MWFSRAARSLVFALMGFAAANATPMMMPIGFAPNGLSGAGGDILKAEIGKSEFILIGEDHGFAGSPLLARAIAAEAKPFGFSHYAVEVGPLTVGMVRTALEKDGLPGLARIVRQAPFAMPFLAFREDAETAMQFLGTDDKGAPRLWGMDQEFVGSTTILLPRLVALAPNAGVREEVSQLLKSEQKAVADGKFDALMLGKAGPEAFDHLANLYPGVGEAQAIIAAMKKSAAIYTLWANNKIYENNQTRARLMAANFLDNYRKAGEPKTILRMGANHTGLGTTTIATVDLGTLTNEIAALHSRRALRILFLPAGGRQMVAGGKSGFMEVPYDDDDVKAFYAGIGLKREDLPPGVYSLVPLEPVRQSLDLKGIEKLPPMSRFLVLGFDYLVTTPDAAPATVLR